MKKALFYMTFVVIITALVVLAVGDKPLLVFKVFCESAFGNKENFSYTLYYAAPLILTGVSVSLALEAGLFNIGAEGQLTMGALFAVIWGLWASKYVGSSVNPFGSIFYWVAGYLMSFLGGGIVGAIAGWLKAKRGTHEVIATIMLNFIVMAFVNWVILNRLKNPENQNLETSWIAEPLRIGRLWLQTNPGIVIAFFTAAVVLFIVSKTWWGFRVRATGQNLTSTHLAGVNTTRIAMLAMFISGGISGTVGFIEIYCNNYRLMDSFSPGLGFTGLAIALIARGNLIKLLCAAILFGALHKGALDLDIETEKITRDLSSVIQALILVVLALATKKNESS